MLEETFVTCLPYCAVKALRLERRTEDLLRGLEVRRFRGEANVNQSFHFTRVDRMQTEHQRGESRTGLDHHHLTAKPSRLQLVPGHIRAYATLPPATPTLTEEDPCSGDQ